MNRCRVSRAAFCPAEHVLLIKAGQGLLSEVVRHGRRCHRILIALRCHELILAAAGGRERQLLRAESAPRRVLLLAARGTSLQLVIVHTLVWTAIPSLGVSRSGLLAARLAAIVRQAL